MQLIIPKDLMWQVPESIHKWCKLSGARYNAQGGNITLKLPDTWSMVNEGELVVWKDEKNQSRMVKREDGMHIILPRYGVDKDTMSDTWYVSDEERPNSRFITDGFNEKDMAFNWLEQAYPGYGKIFNYWSKN